MSNKRKRFKLVVGDWSSDGHEKTEDVYFMINVKTVKDVEKAYAVGTKKLGFDLKNDCCAEYEDNKISDDQVVKLKASGIDLKAAFNFDDADDDPDEEDFQFMDPQTFAHLYMFIAKLGDPKLEFTQVNTDRIERINVGGYGLFMS